MLYHVMHLSRGNDDASFRIFRSRAVDSSLLFSLPAGLRFVLYTGMTSAPSSIDFGKPWKVLRGPFQLFDNSLIVEFLEPDHGLDAS